MCPPIPRREALPSGAVIGDEVDLYLILYGLVYDFGRVLDHQETGTFV